MSSDGFPPPLAFLRIAIAARGKSSLVRIPSAAEEGHPGLEADSAAAHAVQVFSPQPDRKYPLKQSLGREHRRTAPSTLF